MYFFTIMMGKKGLLIMCFIVNASSVFIEYR